MSSPRKMPGRARDTDLGSTLATERDALKALFPLPTATPRGKKGTPGKVLRKGATRALAVAAVALLGSALYWVDPAYQHAQYATAIGERREIKLADGSRISLNTATQLAVSWHLRSRRVALHRGQVLFTVAPATYRPFDVLAGTTRIHVVGTVFDVRNDAGTVTVAVVEGRVRVSEAQQPPALLGAAERIASLDGKLGRRQAIQPETATAWQRGKIVFERSRLDDALREIQRYRKTPIRLHGESIARLEVSGVFETARTDQLLDLLPAILPLRLTRNGDGSVDVGPR